MRVIHRPTGIVVCCERERSQWANRQAAWAELERRLVALTAQSAADAMNTERRRQVTSDRAAKTWTHNFQRGEVTGEGRRWRTKDWYRGKW